MGRRILGFAASLLLACLLWSHACAQHGGSRAGLGGMGAFGAGLEEQPGEVPTPPLLDREIAEGFIAIDGRAEVRVRPTEIRVVLAVTSEGKTAQECQQAIEATIERLKASWAKLKIARKGLVEDFIAVLPLYEWNLEKRGNMEVGVETKVGHRMQTNIHLAVPDDPKAMEALTAAFEQGVTDIIAFDYWSQELDDIKLKAREQALNAARRKSDVLLGALFNDRPPVINVQEQTTIRYPEALYHSFENTLDESVRPPSHRDIPFIRAHRPRNTYYRGLYSDGDVHARELPMHPEISVVSTVRLYFESPAAKRSTNANSP
jgi:uncharacterized protein YggE